MLGWSKAVRWRHKHAGDRFTISSSVNLWVMCKLLTFINTLPHCLFMPHAAFMIHVASWLIMLVFYCMIHFEAWSALVVSVPVENNVLNLMTISLSLFFLWLHSFQRGVFFPSPSTPSSRNCFICTPVSCKGKKMHLPFFSFLSFCPLECTHKFAEHCIKFTKNHFILRLQKWMQKKVLFIFFSWGKKNMSQKRCTYL